jgi:hypothetical protein
MNHKIHRQLDINKGNLNPISYLKMKKVFKNHLKNRLPYDAYFEYTNKRNNRRECLILRYFQKTEVHNQHYELNVMRTDYQIEYHIKSINRAKERYLSKN